MSLSLREVRRGGIHSVREKVVCARVPAACTEAGRKHGFFPRTNDGSEVFFVAQREGSEDRAAL